MSARSSTTVALQAAETAEDRQCQRNNCKRQSAETVRFEGDHTTRALCTSCYKEFLGVSS